jgi:hypothetical protein
MMLLKKKWQDKVKEVSEFHRSHLEAKPSWKIDDTAEKTGYSHGRVCEYLMISDWGKSHPNILEMTTVKEALEFIRRKKFVRRIS